MNGTRVPGTSCPAGTGGARPRGLVADLEDLPCCIRDPRRRRPEDDPGRDGAESAGSATHAGRIGTRPRFPEPEIERHEMPLADLRPACGRDARVPGRPKADEVRAGATPVLPERMDPRLRGNDEEGRDARVPGGAGVHHPDTGAVPAASPAPAVPA